MEIDALGPFEWDDDKQLSNLNKHGIDFEDAVLALDENAYLYRSSYRQEERWVAICPEGGRLIAIVFTMRGRVCRIISARIARQNERRQYHAHHG